MRSLRIRITAILLFIFSCTDKIPLEFENINDPKSDNYIPNQPTSLSFEYSKSSDVKINWKDNSAGEESFIIERRTINNKEEEFGEFTVVDKNVSSYIFSNLDTDKTYQFRVRARKSENYSEYSNTITMGYGLYLSEDNIYKIEGKNTADFGYTSNKNIFYVDNDGILEFYDQNLFLYRINLKDGPYYDQRKKFSISNNGTRLLIYKNDIDIYEIESGNLIDNFKFAADMVLLNNDNSKLLVFSAPSLKLIDIASRTVLWERSVSEDKYYKFKFSEEDEIVHYSKYVDLNSEGRKIYVNSILDFSPLYEIDISNGFTSAGNLDYIKQTSRYLYMIADIDYDRPNFVIFDKQNNVGVFSSSRWAWDYNYAYAKDANSFLISQSWTALSYYDVDKESFRKNIGLSRHFRGLFEHTYLFSVNHDASYLIFNIYNDSLYLINLVKGWNPFTLEN